MAPGRGRGGRGAGGWRSALSGEGCGPLLPEVRKHKPMHLMVSYLLLSVHVSQLVWFARVMFIRSVYVV